MRLQINQADLGHWIALIRESTTSTEVLFCLVGLIEQGNSVVCTYRKLTKMTGKSRATVARSIKLLKDQSWITANKVGNVTFYLVNKERIIMVHE